MASISPTFRSADNLLREYRERHKFPIANDFLGQRYGRYDEHTTCAALTELKLCFGDVIIVGGNHNDDDDVGNERRNL